MNTKFNTLRLQFDKTSQCFQSLQERIESELQFAQYLAEKHPHEKNWPDLIDRAVVEIMPAIENGKFHSLKAAITKAEHLLSPLGRVAKDYRIYCVGHAHIDMNWQWSWPETVAIVNDTFTTVLGLMEEFPDFIFSQSQASVYNIIEEHNPEILDKIRQRVKEGRWEVTASHWVEGDKNIVSGESLCRHLLYTRNYIQALFGLDPESVPIDWAPDTFGHAQTVPAYLRKGGVKYYYLHRPGIHTPPQPRPTAFWWKAPSGEKVLVHNDMRSTYNGAITPNCVPRVLQGFADETGLPFALFVYGVGDHGGGPTRRDLMQLREMNTWPIFPSFCHATVKSYFERLESDATGLPLVESELNFEFTGCFTSQSLIKKSNRYAEKRLVDAESAALFVSQILGTPYPLKQFSKAWHDTLFSHFHDILPGSGVHDTRTFTHGLYQKTTATTSSIETKALRSLASAIDTRKMVTAVTDPSLPARLHSRSTGAGAGYNVENGGTSLYSNSLDRAILIYNPLPYDREEIVEAVIWEDVGGWQQKDLKWLRFTVCSPDGNQIPAQHLENSTYWGHTYIKVAFPVRVGPFGYTVYSIHESSNTPTETSVKQLGYSHIAGYAFYERSPEGLENEYIKFVLDPSTGGIHSLLYKNGTLAFIAPGSGAPLLEYVIEHPHRMDSWNVNHTTKPRSPEVICIKRRHNGPYKAIQEVEMRIEQSHFILCYELRAGDPNLYIHLKGTWFERGTKEKGVPVLRFRLPVNFHSIQPLVYEIPFGAISRSVEHGEEVPALRWAMVKGKIDEKDAGMLLLNDCKHGHSFIDGTLCLTLIRSSTDPDPLPEIGSHEIHLAVRSFEGAMSVNEAIACARRFNHELKLVNTDSHEGTLPLEQSFLVVDGAVVLDSVKMAEGDNACIIRLYEVEGNDANATVSWLSDFGTIAKVELTDIMERPIKELSHHSNCVKVKVPCRQIVTIKLFWE